MKKTEWIMGLPITIEILDSKTDENIFNEIFSYFHKIDNRFSTYKEDSEISKINKGEEKEDYYSSEMRNILTLCEQTRLATNGFFDIHRKDGSLEPAGLVKGWAIFEVAKKLHSKGFHNFYIEAGGDIQVSGKNENDEEWIVGIRNPFKRDEIIKKITLHDTAIATSGTYFRGNHIYNPKDRDCDITDIVSLSVIGPNIYEADRFATAAFAMGKDGIIFIENLEGYEGYMVDKEGIATYTSNFQSFVHL